MPGPEGRAGDRPNPPAAPAPGTGTGHDAGAPGHGDARTWTVEPGQSFWSQSEVVVTGATLASGDRSHPHEAEIAAYWLRLIEANRTDLADPANPDLIFPGQVFRLPA